MIDKTLLAKTQISPFIKHKTTASGNKLRFTSPNKQSCSSQKLKTLNIQSSDSLQNLTKQPRIDKKNIRFLSTQNKSNNTLFKSSQELHQQNSTLKRKIQNLNTNLGKQKVRKEVDIKNMKKIHQKLNIEYSGYIFMDILPHHKYLVEGVKYQYYKLKQQFQQKCSQLNQALKQSNNIQNAELKIYCDALENDNRLLKERVAKMLKVEEQMFKQMQLQQRIDLSQDGCIQASKQWIKEQEKKMIQLLGVSSKIAELEKKAKDATINYEKLKEKSQIQRQLLKQRKYKIVFLQNIIRKKENEIHSIMKKSQNDLRDKDEVIKRLSQSIEQQQRRHKQDIQTLISKNKKKLQTHKDIYQRYLKQSEKQCQAYKREIKRLQLMMKSIENHAHNHNNIPFPKNQKNSICLHKLQQNQHQQVKQQVIDKFSLNFQKESYVQEELNKQRKNLQLQEQQSSINNEVRYIKSSSIKHSINCIKVKPVKIEEIQHLKQQLQYRFIYHRVQIDTVKEYFTLSQSELVYLFKNEQQWLRKYIPLKQIKQKLLKTPFSLSLEMALLFSRYIVEDCTKDTVYYHEDNEIERGVAKSVLRSFVGQYILPNEKEAKDEITQILNKKGNNLPSVLFSRASSGLISYSKLRQICEMIEIFFSEAAWDYLISQLSIKSSIYQIIYKDMFKYL